MKRGILKLKLKRKLMLLTNSSLSFKELSKELNIDVSNVYRSFYKLKKLKFITNKRHITQRGFMFLLESLILSPKTQKHFRLHKLMFRIKILYAKRDLYKKMEQIFKVKVWQIKNNKVREFPMDDVIIRVISNSLLIYTPEIFAQSPELAKEQVLKILNTITPKLEQKLHIKLSTKPWMVVHIGSQHIALTNSTIAKAFLESKIRLEIIDEDGNRRLIVDDSKRLNELEAVHYFYSEEDARKVKDFLGDLVLNDKWNKIKKDIEKIKQVLLTKEETKTYIG